MKCHALNSITSDTLTQIASYFLMSITFTQFICLEINISNIQARLPTVVFTHALFTFLWPCFYEVQKSVGDYIMLAQIFKHL